MKTPYEEAMLAVFIIIALGCVGITSLIWLLIWWLFG